MKNYVSKAFIALIVTNLFFVSCQKDFETIENMTTNDANIKVLHYTSTNSRGGTTSILEFTDMESFRTTLAQLEYDVEKQDDDFIALYGHLDEEAINAKDAEIGFDDTKPLKDFEDSLGFKSLLEDYQAAEDLWLKQEELDEATAPENQFYDLDEEELTLLNKDSAVKIGRSFFVQMHGGVVEITSGSFDTLSGLAYYDNVDDINVDDYDDIDVNYDNDIDPFDPPQCITDWYRKTKIWSTSYKRRMEGILRVQDDPLWGQKLKVKTISFKKGLFGWHRWRTQIRVALDGHAGEENVDDICPDYSRTYYESVDFKYYSNKKKAKYVDNDYDNSPQVSSNELMGVHETQNSYRRELNYN